MEIDEADMIVDWGDESMGMDDACLDHLADVEHLRVDCSTHTSPKPKWRPLNKKKSPSKKSGTLQGDQAGANASKKGMI